MRNRLDRSLAAREAVSRVPELSGLRLSLVFVVFAIAFAAIALRVAWLQTAGRDRYIALWDRTSERLEPLPAPDGRILTSDGQVLAYDEPRYGIVVHYRWLESPPDESWLKSQALRRLAPQDRRSSVMMETARQGVLSEREIMHRELADALGISLEELHARFHGIQQRVERIVSSVEARREQPDDDRDVSSQGAADGPEGWRGLWRRVCEELTTPPARRVREPLIVAEELQYHVVESSAPVSVVARIQSSPSRFTGVDVRHSAMRVYPLGRLAAHLVGARSPLRDDEWELRRQRNADPLGFRSGESIGRSGIELSCEAALHGIAGVRRVISNRQGEIVRQEIVRAPVEGRDIILTVDSRLQRTAEALLDAAVNLGEIPASSNANAGLDGVAGESPLPLGGSLVAIDVRTGAILAAASAPGYNASLLVESNPVEWQAVASDSRRPFFPRATRGALPPGSVFKLVTAIAGLEAGLIDPGERFDCRGYLERPDRERCAIYRNFGVGHGAITLQQALAQSCNVYFYEAARRLGPRPLATWAQRFGFGAPTGCGVPDEAAGHLPSPDDARADGEPWYPGTTRQFGVGQATLTATPLQVARMVAAVANGGWLIAPHFVRDAVESGAPPPPSTQSGVQLASLLAVEGAGGVHRPVRVPRLDSETLRPIREAMIAAVEHPRGTAREALLKGVRIAGKTGTAETGGGRPDHAWFAGFAPADTPQIAIVVVLEHGGSGGRAAAPLAREFVRAWSEAPR